MPEQPNSISIVQHLTAHIVPRSLCGALSDSERAFLVFDGNVQTERSLQIIRNTENLLCTRRQQFKSHSHIKINNRMYATSCPFLALAPFRTSCPQPTNRTRTSWIGSRRRYSLSYTHKIQQVPHSAPHSFTPKHFAITHNYIALFGVKCVCVFVCTSCKSELRLMTRLKNKS